MNYALRKVRTKLRTALRERDGDDCWICHGLMLFGTNNQPEAATIDHITPRSKGGTHDLANLRLAHYRCNNERGNGESAMSAWRQEQAA